MCTPCRPPDIKPLEQLKKSSACVYWVHLKGQSNYNLLGYVGVTTKDPYERVTEHYTAYLKAKRSRQKLKPLHELFSRHGYSGIEVSVIFEGTEEACYAFEAKVRPHGLIGLNIAPGGKNPLGF